MSTEQLATFSSSSAPQSVPNVASKNIPSSQQSSPQSTSSPALAGPSTWQSTPAHKNPRSKARTSEENEITKATAAKFASRLAEDHSAVLDPDVDTPFVDSVDVVKRLLPYHIFLNPVEDLRPLITDRKGKSKAEELSTENAGKFLICICYEFRSRRAETEFALECFKRRRDLEKRFRHARIKSGEVPFMEEIVVVSQLGLESDRSDLALLSSELRAARSELERLERAKKAASNNVPRASYYNTPLPPSTPAGATAYYRTYAYAQPYAAGINSPTVTTFPVTPATAATTATTTTTTSAPTPTPVPVPVAGPPSTTPSVPYQAGVAIPVPMTTAAASGVPASTPVPSNTTAAPIPVQLPVACLPALYRIGITPVPPTTGQPAPPAVLRGSNGSMLNLEINVSLLQPGQMSGLALILNSLMTRASTNLTVPTTTAVPTVPPTNGTANGSSG